MASSSHCGFSTRRVLMIVVLKRRSQLVRGLTRMTNVRMMKVILRMKVAGRYAFRTDHVTPGKLITQSFTKSTNDMKLIPFIL